MIITKLVTTSIDTLSSNVLTIDASTYGAAVVRHADLLLNFHAPWCSFCVEHRPVYDDVAAQFREVRIHVDCKMFCQMRIFELDYMLLLILSL